MPSSCTVSNAITVMINWVCTGLTLTQGNRKKNKIKDVMSAISDFCSEVTSSVSETIIAIRKAYSYKSYCSENIWETHKEILAAHNSRAAWTREQPTGEGKRHSNPTHPHANIGFFPVVCLVYFKHSMQWICHLFILETVSTAWNTLGSAL